MEKVHVAKATIWIDTNRRILTTHIKIRNDESIEEFADRVRASILESAPREATREAP